jgi:hypothetical protein
MKTWIKYAFTLLLISLLIANLHFGWLNFLHGAIAGTPIFITWFWYVFRPDTLRKMYTIKEGEDSSGNSFYPFWKRDEVHFRFLLTESCVMKGMKLMEQIADDEIETTKEKYQQLTTQRNKIFGFGFVPHHHDNSYRLGFKQYLYNMESKVVDLLAYFYRDGYVNPDLKEYTLMPANINEWYRCNIKLGHRMIDEEEVDPIVTYRIFDDRTGEILCEKSFSRAEHHDAGYFLKPFTNDSELGFAPWDIKINIQFLPFSLNI